MLILDISINEDITLGEVKVSRIALVLVLTILIVPGVIGAPSYKSFDNVKLEGEFNLAEFENAPKVAFLGSVVLDASRDKSMTSLMQVSGKDILNALSTRQLDDIYSNANIQNYANIDSTINTLETNDAYVLVTMLFKTTVRFDAIKGNGRVAFLDNPNRHIDTFGKLCDLLGVDVLILGTNYTWGSYSTGMVGMNYFLRTTGAFAAFDRNGTILSHVPFVKTSETGFGKRHDPRLNINYAGKLNRQIHIQDAGYDATKYLEQLGKISNEAKSLGINRNTLAAFPRIKKKRNSYYIASPNSPHGANAVPVNEIECYLMKDGALKSETLAGLGKGNPNTFLTPIAPNEYFQIEFSYMNRKYKIIH